MTWIKKAYLYLVTLISLIILVIAAIMLINLALKSWVFPKADRAYFYDPAIECQTAQVKNPDGSLAPQPHCTAENIEARRKQEAENRAAQKQQSAAQALAMILVGAPVFYYHWKLARKEA